MKRYDLPTQEELKQLFTYGPSTGSITWNKDQRSGVKAGSEAGYVTNRGYKSICIKGRQMLAHRLIWVYMTGSVAPEEIDHINRDKLDNRWDNLRLANRTSNQANKTAQKNNRLQLKGVSEDRGRYRARININGKTVTIGSFGSPEKAHEAYQQKAKQDQSRNKRNNKLAEYSVALIKRYLSKNIMTHKEISKLFGVTESAISCIATGKTWRDIEPA